MALSIHVKPDARSAAESVKRTAATQRLGLRAWRCKCEGGTRVNKRSLVNCPDCWTRRDKDGVPVD